VIADNLSTHKTQAVRTFLGIFASVADLARRIRCYIRQYTKAARPIRWTYRNPAHRYFSQCGPLVGVELVHVPDLAERPPHVLHDLHLFE
jgi:hypothetical protein